MRRSGTGSGGGYQMNKHRDSRAPKVEPRANAYNPGGVAQWGQAQGTHSTHGRESDYRGDPKRIGRGYEAPYGITDPVSAVGVGGGRKIYASGSQGTQGSVAPGNPRPNTYRDAFKQE
jgi:hypothetical protein